MQSLRISEIFYHKKGSQRQVPAYTSMALVWNWIVPVYRPDMLLVHVIEEAEGRGRFFFFFFPPDKFISVLFINNACSENVQCRNM